MKTERLSIYWVVTNYIKVLGTAGVSDGNEGAKVTLLLSSCRIAELAGGWRGER
jgi:hypothetical protein